MTTEEFWSKVNSADYKVTQPRLALIAVLVQNQSLMQSAEELYAQTKHIFPKTNLSTIYRNLETLEGLNMLYKITTDEGMNLYKLKCANDSHHHHIICTKCGNVLDVEYCPFDSFSEIARKTGFSITEHRLELYGLCQNCQHQQNAKTPQP